MTSVCSVGLDMIAIPGDTPRRHHFRHHRRRNGYQHDQLQTTAVRHPRYPRKGRRRKNLLRRTPGEADIIPVPGDDGTFISLGGRIPRRSQQELRGMGKEGDLSGESSPSFPNPILLPKTFICAAARRIGSRL